MLGTFVGMMALIPIIGPYIGAAVGCIMLFSISPAKSLELLIYLFLLQQVEGNLIYPHTVGSKSKLPGLSGAGGSADWRRHDGQCYPGMVLLRPADGGAVWAGMVANGCAVTHGWSSRQREKA